MTQGGIFPEGLGFMLENEEFYLFDESLSDDEWEKDPDDGLREIPPEVLAKIVDPRPEISIAFDYPLHHPVVVTFQRPGGNWSLEALVRAVATGYKRIYEEEDAGKTAETDQGIGVLNRGESDGPYGIWGHDMEDLVIEDMTLDAEGVWILQVGS